MTDLTDSELSFELLSPRPTRSRTAVPQAEPAEIPALATEVSDWAKLLDLRNVLQPTELGDRDEDFADWRYLFENSMRVLGITKLMQGSVTMNHEPVLEEMMPKERQQAAILHMILVATVKRSHKATVIVQSVNDCNGFVAWRRLVRAYRPISDDRLTTMYLALLQPKWTMNQFANQLQEWENAVHKYQRESGETIPDRAKVVAVVRNVPDELHDLIRKSPRSITSSYEVLKAVIVDYLDRGDTFDFRGNRQQTSRVCSPIDMEVDALQFGRQSRTWRQQQPQQWIPRYTPTSSTWEWRSGWPSWGKGKWKGQGWNQPSQQGKGQGWSQSFQQPWRSIATT